MQPHADAPHCARFMQLNAQQQAVLAHDLLCCHLEALAQRSEVLHAAANGVAAVRFVLRNGLDVVLKLTLEERATFEAAQIEAEMHAAVRLPVSPYLSQLLAWRRDAAGNVLAVSLFAGRTAEQLLQEPASQGGWAGLPLPRRIEVCRQVLAGVLRSLQEMAPLCHHDLKPANVAVRDSGSGLLLTALLDMGAAKHVAALRSPDRCNVYPVISAEHLDATLLTRGANGTFWLDTEEGCLAALSVATDIFCAGLLAVKILMAGDEPEWLTWESQRYAPHDAAAEGRFAENLEAFHGELEYGFSSCPQVEALLRQLPRECVSCLYRMCAFDPTGRPSLQQALQLPFVADTVKQLRSHAALHGAVHEAAWQQALGLLQHVPGIRLARQPPQPPPGSAAQHRRNATSSGGGGRSSTWALSSRRPRAACESMGGGSSSSSSSAHASACAQRGWHDHDRGK